MDKSEVPCFLAHPVEFVGNLCRCCWHMYLIVTMTCARIGSMSGYWQQSVRSRCSACLSYSCGFGDLSMKTKRIILLHLFYPHFADGFFLYFHRYKMVLEMCFCLLSAYLCCMHVFTHDVSVTFALCSDKCSPNFCHWCISREKVELLAVFCVKAWPLGLGHRWVEWYRSLVDCAREF